jgi:hypothetical protein
MDTAYGAASMFLEKLFQAPLMQNIQDTEALQWDNVFTLVKNKKED